MAVRGPKGRLRVKLQVNWRVRDKADGIRLNALAVSALAEARRRFREGKVGCCSCRNRLDRFLEESLIGLDRRKIKSKTAERHRRRLLAFDRFFQGKPLDAIGSERLERYIKTRLGEVGADTVNAELVSLRAYARWAQRKKYAPDILPILSVGRLHVPGKLPGRNRKPPEAIGMGEMFDIIRTVGETRPDIRLFLLGMAHFGLRPESVCAFRREHAKPPRGKEAGRLFAKGLKGELDEWITIPPGSLRAEWLRACLALGRRAGLAGPRAPLVPRLSKKPGRIPGAWTTGALDMALGRLCRKLAIRFVPYTIRHSCMTYLKRCEGISSAASQRYAKHMRVETQNAYDHLLGLEAEPAYERMERAMREHGI